MILTDYPVVDLADWLQITALSPPLYPHSPYVYFLWHVPPRSLTKPRWLPDELVYIGKSTNIFLRLYNHHKRFRWDFVCVTAWECGNQQEMERLEPLLIRYWQPFRNIQYL